MKGCDWGKVAGWTKYLFSDGDEGYKAQQEKTAFIQNCEEEIAELVESTRKQMSFDHLNKKHLKDARRIIVTNIAADAGVYELAVVFDDFEM